MAADWLAVCWAWAVAEAATSGCEGRAVGVVVHSHQKHVAEPERCL